MKKSIGKAAELVTKEVGALRRNAGVLRARLLFLASPRRRAAVLAGISRHIRALTTPRQPCQDKAKAAAAQRQRYHCRGASRSLAPPDDDDEGVAVVAADGGLLHHHLPVPAASSLMLLVQEGDGDDDGGCTADDWTLALRSLFDDEDDGHHGADHCSAAAATDGLDVDDEESSSVIDVIRRRREGDGQEFRIEDEIDRAADMYITKVRRRMSKQLEDLILATSAAGPAASH